MRKRFRVEFEITYTMSKADLLDWVEGDETVWAKECIGDIKGVLHRTDFVSAGPPKNVSITEIKEVPK